MKQYDAINIILEQLVTNQFIMACYLKGSFVTKKEDNYSKIEMYCLVNNENLRKLIKMKEEIFEKYDNILFIQEQNNFIQCVYENGLVFFLQLMEEVKHDLEEKLIIYDPNQIISPSSNLIQATKITDLIHQFSFQALEYYASIKRDDLMCSFLIIQQMVQPYFLLYLFLLNSTNYSLKIHQIWTILKEEQKKEFIDILKWITFDKHQIAAKLLVEKMHQLIGYLPLTIANFLNLDFFLYAKNKITSISEEKI